MESPLLTVYQYASRYLEQLPDLPVNAAADWQSLRYGLDHALQNQGIAASEVIRQLINDCEKGIVHSTSGRFFGWVMGGHVPSALAADWLTSMWDQNAALYASGPSAAVVEEVAGTWLNPTGKPAGPMLSRRYILLKK
jgi:hypothetical protein